MFNTVIVIVYWSLYVLQKLSNVLIKTGQKTSSGEDRQRTPSFILGWPFKRGRELLILELDFNERMETLVNCTVMGVH